MPSVLSRQLTDQPPAPRPTGLDAFKLARRKFMAGERIEMLALAREIGVTRATLHRWVGSRDELLCEVLWSLAKPVLDDATSRTRATGGRRVALIMDRFVKTVLANDFFRDFLTREPEIALRILTTNRTDFQHRVIVSVEEILRDEITAGRLDQLLEPPDLAYLVVRVYESFIYTDTITGADPDPAKATRSITALLT